MKQISLFFVMLIFIVSAANGQYWNQRQPPLAVVDSVYEEVYVDSVAADSVIEEYVYDDPQNITYGIGRNIRTCYSLEELYSTTVVPSQAIQIDWRTMKLK